MSNINSPVINNRLRNKAVELTFQYSSEQVPYKGYIIDFSKDWLLMKLIVGDYALDGYVILNMRFIVDFPHLLELESLIIPLLRRRI